MGTRRELESTNKTGTKLEQSWNKNIASDESLNLLGMDGNDQTMVKI
jgi:hypothetical protein